jgi:hypothetical protein
MEPEVSLPCLQELSSDRCPEPLQVRGTLWDYVTSFFYDEELLAPRSTPKLEDHLLFPLCIHFLRVSALFVVVPRPRSRCDVSVNEHFVEARIEVVAVQLFHFSTKSRET